MKNLLLVLIVIFVAVLILYSLNTNTKETFDGNIQLGNAPLDYGIGPYSNVRLEYLGENYWRNPSMNKPLLQNMYTVQGTPAPLKYEEAQSMPDPDTAGTTVDGTPKTPASMFMFAFNRQAPECCPSTYSSSLGCVCQTDKQMDVLNKRGNNRTFPTEY